MLLAPNGHKSNLTPEQYRLVRTPAFKNWFGDWENDYENASKVVDTNGEPMVMYHGTAKHFKFNVFDENKQGNNYYGNGFYFTNDKKDVKQYGAKIITVFLSIKKPFILNNKTKKLADKYADTNNYLEKDLEQFSKYTIGYRAEHPNLFQQNIKKDGYDGLFIDDSEYTKNTFIAYYPEQIKLADGSNTAFDGSNPDIRFDDGGELIDYYGFYNNNRLIGVGKAENQSLNDKILYLDSLHDKGYTLKAITEQEYLDYNEGDELTQEDINLGNYYNINDSKKFDTDGDIMFDGGGESESVKVYHSTTRKFNEFDTSKLGEATKSGSAKVGFWFTDDVATAKSYARAENWRKVQEFIDSGDTKSATELEDKIFENKDTKYLKEIILRYKNPLTIDADGRMYNDFSDEIIAAIKKAQDNNHDVLIVERLSDNADYSEYTPATHYLVLDNSITESGSPDVKFAKGGGIEDVLHKEVLEKIKNKLNLKSFKKIGSGRYGTAFKISSNKVLKITKDLKEYEYAKKIQGLKNKHIADIYEAYHFEYNDTKYAIIIKEYCLVDEYRTDRLIDSFLEYTGNQMSLSFVSSEFLNGDVTKNVFDNYFKKYKQNEGYASGFAEQWYDMIMELKIKKIYVKDFNGANIGYKPSNNNLAIIELGLGYWDLEKLPFIESDTLTFKKGGLLAPNGNPSNLTTIQYRLVRTPEFKAWFGDWETLSKAKTLENNITGFYKGAFKGNEELFLFEMAQQANNSESEKSGAIKVAGKELVELALKLFPNVKIGHKFIPIVSKVVDENGEPKVMYHGSTSQFTVFSNQQRKDTWRYPFVFVTDVIHIAKEFAKQRLYDEYGVKQKINVYKLFVNMKNPFDIFNNDDNYKLTRDVNDNAFFGRKDETWMYLETPEMAKIIKDKNYDGIYTTETIALDAKHNYEKIFTKNIAVFNPNQVKLADGTNKTFDIENSDMRFDDGGNISSATSRFRPRETILFNPPIVGVNGAKLLSYEWTYEFEEYFNQFKGEVATKRVSDWDRAIASADTGKNIVHQFTVEMPDGETRMVSSESVLILLGYTERTALKSFPSLVNSIKTLAKQKMQLSLMEAQQKQYDELRIKFEKSDKPQITIATLDQLPTITRFMIEKGDSSTTFFAMGDVVYGQGNESVYDSKEGKSRYIPAEVPNRTTKEQLNYFWVDARIKENDGSRPNGLYDLKNRVKRQESKVKQITEQTSMETKKFADGGKTDDYENVSVDYLNSIRTQ